MKVISFLVELFHCAPAKCQPATSCLCVVLVMVVVVVCLLHTLVNGTVHCTGLAVSQGTVALTLEKYPSDSLSAT